MAIDFSKTKKARTKKEEEPESFLPVVRPTADIARMGILKFENEIKLMTIEAAQITTIENDETLSKASELAGRAKKLYDVIEKERKDIVESPNKWVSSINNFTKSFTTPLRSIFSTESDLNRKITQYNSHKELERRKQEEAARKETEALQKKLNEDAKKIGVEAPIVPEMVMPKAETVVRTDSGSSFQRKDWVFEMEDENLLPRDCLMRNDQAIRAKIKAGIRTIPGVRIFEKSSTTFRTA